MTVGFGMYKVGTEYGINMGEEVLHFTFLLCVLQLFSFRPDQKADKISL